MDKKYCCDMFKESVEEGKIERSATRDETEWHFPEWYHLYFCPFCGKNIKGKGYGVYDKQKKSRRISSP